jgi:two-component system LytT family sensor kinase
VRLLLVGLTVVVLVALPALAFLRAVRARHQFGTSVERVTFDVLHAVSEAAPHFRAGLTEAAAGRAARSLRRLLGCSAIAITDRDDVLAWDGEGAHHAAAVPDLARPVFEDGRPVAVDPGRLACADVGCPVRSGVVVPIEVGGTVVGTLAAMGTSVKAGTIRAAGEVAQWVATQIELGRLDQSEARAAAAELRALRAQISPHFVYNALTAIASFVRTDPERARELLLQFAEFTRYSFRSQAQFTTLAEELRAIDAYLLLERARFGDRLAVTLRVAPEVLPVTLPFLVLQPLVENAVRHGIERRGGPGRITIAAEDAGSECRISVEDNGVGMDPEQLRRQLAGDGEAGRIGLANVDERLRTVFGDEFGLVVETAPGAGTRVCLRVPKYRAGVRAS